MSRDCYLQVSYHRGRALAGYYYLPRQQAQTSVRCRQFERDLVVDYADDGTPIGIEIVSPTQLTLDAFNAVLVEHGFAPASAAELKPLAA